MTKYDELLQRLGGGINLLPLRARTAVFLACGRALLGEYEGWAAPHDIGRRIIQLVDEACEGFVLRGELPPDAVPLLAQLASVTPEGDAENGRSATAAQDCWICYDTALRSASDSSFEPGVCVEYALQPVSEAVAERLFSVSQIGSGPDEDSQVDLLVNDPQLKAAAEFCELAITELEDAARLTRAGLARLVSGATALVP